MKKVITAVICVVLAAVVCVLAFDNGYSNGIDMTSGRFFTLSKETCEYLNTVKDKVNITVLQQKDAYTNKGASQPYFIQVTRILDAMDNYKSIDVSYTNYEEIESADEGDIIVSIGEKSKVLTDDSLFEFSYSYDSEGNAYGTLSASVAETVICSAIYDLLNVVKPVACFTLGFDEHAYYTNYADLLVEAGYDVRYVDYGQDKTIPEECQLLVIFAPTSDISAMAQSDIEAYMYNDGAYGKNCVYVANSSFVTDFPNLNSFLTKWGITIQPYVVMETDENNFVIADDAFYTEGFYIDTQYITDYTYLENAVTVPFSHPIEFDEGETTLTNSVLIQSTDTSCLTAWDSEGNYYYGEDGTFTTVQCVSYYQTDLSGSSYTGNVGSIAVVGSEYAFEQKVLDNEQFSNSAYFVDLSNSLSGVNDYSVSIPSKYYTMKGTTVSDTARPLLIIVFVGIFPLVITFVGVVKMLRFRKRVKSKNIKK